MRKLVQVLCFVLLFCFIAVGDHCHADSPSETHNGPTILVDCEQEHPHQLPESSHLCHMGHCPYDLPKVFSLQKIELYFIQAFLVLFRQYLPPHVPVHRPPPRFAVG